MKRKVIRFFVLPVFLAAMLASCAPRPAPTPDPAVLAQTVSARVTELAVQTLTAYVSPTPTPQPTITDTSAPAVTPTPTVQTVDFTGSEIFTAFLDDGQSQVSIIVPNGIKGDYTAIIDKKEFSCFSYIMKTVPRLICVGPALPHGYILEIVVYPKGSPVSIYTRQFTTPY